LTVSVFAIASAPFPYGLRAQKSWLCATDMRLLARSCSLTHGVEPVPARQLGAEPRNVNELRRSIRPMRG
jgi:hypothetical protein